MEGSYQELSDFTEKSSPELQKPWLWPDIMIMLLQATVATITFLFIGWYDMDACGHDMRNLILGSGVFLATDTVVIILNILIVRGVFNKLKPLMLANFAMFLYGFKYLSALFYIGWSIYGGVAYFDKNECHRDWSNTDMLGFGLFTYFTSISGLILLACCCKGCLICMAATSLLESRNRHHVRSE